MTSYDLKESANAKQIKPKLKTPHVDVCGWVGRGDIVPLTPAINAFPHESHQRVEIMSVASLAHYSGQ